jgi:thiol-disulfide isomerase/thioredoxin
MTYRKNRWWMSLAAMTLLAAAAGCARSTKDASSSADKAKPAGSTLPAADSALPPAPAVSFQNLQGQTETLAQYRGKVVLVNFWATWCEPCRQEMPELIALQNEYGNKGFTVLGIAMDQSGKSAVAPFVAQREFKVGDKEQKLNYPIVLGNDDIATKFGGLFGLPTSFLITKNGRIETKVIGMIDYSGMKQLIQKSL